MYYHYKNKKCPVCGRVMAVTEGWPTLRVGYDRKGAYKFFGYGLRRMRLFYSCVDCKHREVKKKLIWLRKPKGQK